MKLMRLLTLFGGGGAVVVSPFTILTITDDGGAAMLTLAATPASPPAVGSWLIITGSDQAEYNGTPFQVSSTSGPTITLDRIFGEAATGGTWAAFAHGRGLLALAGPAFGFRTA